MVFTPSTIGLQPTAAAQAVLQSVQWAIAAGTSDAITAAYPVPNTALTDGLILGFRASAGNATATPTFAPDGLAPHTITKLGGAPLIQGDIAQALAEILVRYNLANTRWELLNPSNDVGAGSWATAGGTAQAITASYNPANAALQDGLLLSFRALFANTGPGPTFSPDSLASAPITKWGGVVLDPGDIAGPLNESIVRYNFANARWELLNPQSQQPPFVVTAGGPTAYTATLAPALTGLLDGQIMHVRWNVANTTTTPTFSPNGLTARNITKFGGQPLAPGDINPAQESILTYNTANTRWELSNPAQGAQGVDWAIAGGTVDAITAAYTPPNPTLFDGMQLRFRGSGSNTLTTSTFSPDGLTAHTIVKRGSTAIAAGDIVALGEYVVTYNLANTRWVLMNPTAP